MNAEFERAQVRAARRVQIEEMLRNYHEIEPDALGAMVNWFKYEASAMDEAMLSSVDDINDAYRAFCKEHLDRSEKGTVLTWMVLGVTVVAALLLAAFYLT